MTNIFSRFAGTVLTFGFLVAALISGFFIVAPFAEAATLPVLSNLTNESYYNAVVKSADRLVILQNANGSWDWVVTGASGPTATTFLNITGVTAEGLLSAYTLTGNQTYLNAAKTAGDFIISTIDGQATKSINAYNVLFLKKLGNASGITSYSDKAAEYFGMLYSATPTTICASGCVDSAGIVDGQKTRRGWTDASPDGIVPWDLAPYVEYANLVGDITHATEIKDAIVSSLSAVGYLPGIGNYDLGLASGVKVSALLGDTTNSSALSALLSTTNTPAGSFGTLTDGQIQASSYTLRAFQLSGDSRKDATAQYIATNFNGTGGWIETDSNEYSEVNSEAATALSLMLPQSVQFYSIQSAVDAATAGDTIELSGNVTTSAQVNVNKSLTIDGKGFTLNATFTKTDNSNNSAIGVTSNDVTIKNIVVDGTGGTNLHGINIYQSTGINLDAVALSNNGRAGVVVNGSTVIANNITTTGSGWGGINVDQGSGVTSPASLTVNGTSVHTETGPAIWLDDTTKNVSVTDTNNQYTYTDTGNLRIYNLKSLANPTTDLGTFVDGVGTTTATITINTGDTNIEISAGTVVTSTDTNWDGVMNIPTVTTAPTITPEPGNTATAVLAIEVGDGDTPITFDQPVKLTFAGQAGNLIGWSQGGTFHAITATCDSLTTPTLATGADCKIVDGSDLVVWTKHFTTFVTYTQTPVSVVASGGGGGGGGGPAGLFGQVNNGQGGFVTPGGVIAQAAPQAVAQVTSQPTGRVLGATTFSFGRYLTFGVRGGDVTELHKRLIAAGFLAIPSPTGYFGPLTQKAVRAFQARFGIEQTGTVGPKTRAELNKEN